jgi:class 3 adenylate cyclase
MDIQRRMKGFSAAQSDATMRVRIGLHSGFMIAEGDDFVGRSVILAARIADRARGGEILVSDMLKDYVSTDPSFSFQEGQQLSLKGLSGMHTVHPVDCRDN